MDYTIEHNSIVARPPACLPTVTKTAVDTLLCALSTRWEPFPRGGEIQTTLSYDEGHTWTHPETIWRSPDPRVTIKTDGRMMTLQDGNILLPVTYHLVPARDDASGTPPTGDHDIDLERLWIDMHDLRIGHRQHHVHCLRSGDHGQTWTNIAVGDMPQESGLLVQFGRPIELESGDVLMPTYTVFSEEARADGLVDTPGFCRSTDGGWSWGPHEPIDIGWSSEANILELKDGTLLAIVRDTLDQEKRRTFGITRSSDGGRTWADARPLDVQGKMPDLWEEPDGRLLFVVGAEGCARGREIYYQRDRRSFNILFISDDGGDTWRRDVELPPVDDETEIVPADDPTFVPMGDGRYYVVHQSIDRGKDRKGHALDFEYYTWLQGTMIAPT